jgi:hypothetical protein
MQTRLTGPGTPFGVFLVRVDGEGVLMDIRTNRYWGLTSLATEIWSQLATGCSLDHIAEYLMDLHSWHWQYARLVLHQQLSTWAELGLLEPVVQGHPLPEPVELPGDIAEREGSAVSSSERIRGMISVVKASLWCKRSLRCRGLASVLSAVQQIPVSPELGVSDRAVDATVIGYRVLRRIASQGSADCLDRSLALTVALRRHGVPAHVCFGVTKTPFLAHARVQIGHWLINDRVSTVNRFQRIVAF